jgi:hypothetical protein
MKPRGFFNGVTVGALLALAGAIGYAGLAPVIGGHLAARCLVAALGGGYVLYLLTGSGQRIGRLAVVATWLGITVSVAMLTPALPAALITQTVLISAVRTLYYHARVLPGIADLLLSAFALSAAVWAGTGTGSFFLSAWSFFLVQALFVAIPARFPGRQRASGANAGNDAFGRAFRTAEAAIRRIAAEHS